MFVDIYQNVIQFIRDLEMWQRSLIVAALTMLLLLDIRAFLKAHVNKAKLGIRISEILVMAILFVLIGVFCFLTK